MPYLQNITTKENETLLAIGTAYVQGEDVAARGRVLLFSVEKNTDNSQNLVFSIIWSLVILVLFCFYISTINSVSFGACVFSCSPFLNSPLMFFQVSEIYSKELKGAISALASLQGHLLIASGPKIILHKWTGTELNGVAFFDAPPLYVVSLNIVRTTSLTPISCLIVDKFI